ncbi:MAG: hypothetical protein AB7W16_11010 [Candidatus Obscuribacterales bacterium]
MRSREGEPLSLCEEPDRRVVMILGPSALGSIASLPGALAVAALGYPPAYIKRKLEQGYRFRLALFERPDGPVRLATWAQTIEAVCEAYPEVASIIRRQAGLLATSSSEDIDCLAGFSLEAVDEAGPSDPRFMTLGRLAESGGSLVEVRSFLYHTVRLNGLFTGDGRTMTASGMPGLREYIISNRPIETLRSFEIVDLI